MSSCAGLSLHEKTDLGSIAVRLVRDIVHQRIFPLPKKKMLGFVLQGPLHPDILDPCLTTLVLRFQHRKDCVLDENMG